MSTCRHVHQLMRYQAHADNVPALLHNACRSVSQVNGNFLVQIELMPPPKAEALAHLDGGGPAPKRYARVTVIRGGHDDCMDYQAGRGPNEHSRLQHDEHQTSCGQCAHPVIMARACKGIMVPRKMPTA
jgi:Copper amine oxidase, N2 domain